MRMNPPTVAVFWICIVLAIVAVVSHRYEIPVLSRFSFWILLAAFVLLALGTMLPGL